MSVFLEDLGKEGVAGTLLDESPSDWCGSYAGSPEPHRPRRNNAVGKIISASTRDTTYSSVVSAVVDSVPQSELRLHVKGGRLCRDFAVTVEERWRRNLEGLWTPKDSARWFVEAVLIDTAPHVSANEPARTRAVREAIDGAAKRAGDGVSATADVDLINGVARQVVRCARLCVAVRRDIETRPATLVDDGRLRKPNQDDGIPRPPEGIGKRGIT
jgi:Putative stress-induced transcription regulator